MMIPCDEFKTTETFTFPTVVRSKFGIPTFVDRWRRLRSLWGSKVIWTDEKHHRLGVTASSEVDPSTAVWIPIPGPLCTLQVRGDECCVLYQASSNMKLIRLTSVEDDDTNWSWSAVTEDVSWPLVPHVRGRQLFLLANGNVLHCGWTDILPGMMRYTFTSTVIPPETSERTYSTQTVYVDVEKADVNASFTCDGSSVFLAVLRPTSFQTRRLDLDTCVESTTTWDRLPIYTTVVESISFSFRMTPSWLELFSFPDASHVTVTTLCLISEFRLCWITACVGRK